MEFSMAFSATLDVNHQVELLQRIEDYLDITLAGTDVGKGMKKCILGISCMGPLNKEWVDVPTMITEMKYTQSVKTLVLDVILSHQAVKNASIDELADLLIKVIGSAQQHMSQLGIPDFDAMVFVELLTALLNNREQLTNPKYDRSDFVMGRREDFKLLGDRPRMRESSFWQLIHDTKSVTRDGIHIQLLLLETRLAAMDADDIIGFEMTLRDLITIGHTYDTLVVLNLAEHDANEELMLCFICTLIMNGSDVFKEFTRGVYQLKTYLRNEPQAVGLLTIADRAYKRKLGEQSIERLPSLVAKGYRDYNKNMNMLGVVLEGKEYDRYYKKAMQVYQQKK